MTPRAHEAKGPGASRRRGTPLALAIAGMLAVVALPFAVQAQAGSGADGPTMAADGSPLPGFDPASQPQTSLDEAAARPLPEQAKADDRPNSGGAAPGREALVDGSVGLDASARGVNDGTKRLERQGKPARPAKPGDVLTEASITGGCHPGYGRKGECLPIVPPSHAAHADHDMTTAWTCAEVRDEFPSGIAVRQAGRDPLRLDTDGDGVACDRGDVR